MVPNPLTPPNEASAEAGDIELDNVLSGVPVSHHLSTMAAFGTPASMNLDGLEGRSDIEEERSDPLTQSDEDQDMSDGGAVLTMTLSHAEQMNAELDLLDAEMMGEENLYGLLTDSDLAPSMFYADSDFTQDQDQDQSSQTQSDYAMDDVYMHDIAHPISIPTTMSEVAQQLQHLQEGQAHAEADAADEGDAALLNSTPSVLLPFFSNFQEIAVAGGPQMDYVSMSQIVPFNVPAVGPNIQQSTLDPQDLLLLSDLPVFHHPGLDMDIMSDADYDEGDEHWNMTLGDFLQYWGASSVEDAPDGPPRRRPKGPSLAALHQQRFAKLEPVQRKDLQGEKCDIQRIDWDDLGVTRLEARQMRRAMYKNYRNLRREPQWHPRLNGSRLADDQNFFRFRRMDFDHDINLSHFQLRNLMACPSRDHVFYAGRGQVCHWNPLSGSASTRPSIAMDLTNPSFQTAHPSGPILISTLTTAHDILVAGGHHGEYGLVNLRAQKDTKHVEGLITDQENSITNHIQVHLSRNSSLPLVTFASNDHGMRILDVNTNKFIMEHTYKQAINCSAISPDQRLRVLVGDTRQVLIVNSETGDVMQSLDGHRDFGFSCDWADDGWTVATGNQDMQVKIWDARKWTNSSGHAQPVATIAADMAGVRNLKFSPVGSGKRVLLAAEPADIIHVIDGESFTSKQTLSFFGEIGGMQFTNDGQDIFVANCDSMRGGLMQFERCDLAAHGLYGLADYEDSRRRNRVRRHGAGYDWMRTDEEVVSHPKARGTEEQRYRKAAKLGIAMGHF